MDSRARLRRRGIGSSTDARSVGAPLGGRSHDRNSVCALVSRCAHRRDCADHSARHCFCAIRSIPSTSRGPTLEIAERGELKPGKRPEYVAQRIGKGDRPIRRRFPRLRGLGRARRKSASAGEGFGTGRTRPISRIPAPRRPGRLLSERAFERAFFSVREPRRRRSRGGSGRPSYGWDSRRHCSNSFARGRSQRQAW